MSELVRIRDDTYERIESLQEELAGEPTKIGILSAAVRDFEENNQK